MFVTVVSGIEPSLSKPSANKKRYKKDGILRLRCALGDESDDILGMVHSCTLTQDLTEYWVDQINRRFGWFGEKCAK